MTTMATFAELGFPFPLFEAPIADAEYHGAGICSLCRENAVICFELDIGCAVMLSCDRCGTDNGLDASDRRPAPCRKCAQLIPFPPIAGPILSCYSCLRAGTAAITKNTELGMVSWEQAFDGMTHGAPRLNHPDFEMIPTDSDWVRARLSQATMFELLRTPNYMSIQGECWLFCCKQPMFFVGCWSREEFSRRAPDGDGQSYFDSVVKGVVPGLWEDRLHDETGVYVFRCQTCGRYKAHWDLA